MTITIPPGHVEPTVEPPRCQVCGWPLAASREEGCVEGNCAMRPRPSPTYAERLAATEKRPEDELATVRAVLRRLCLAQARWFCSDSLTAAELTLDERNAIELEFDEALQAAHDMLGLTFCLHCGRPCAAGDDLCDRPECRERADEVGAEVGQ
jgi:hypothetical protein